MLAKDADVPEAMTTIVQSGRAGCESQGIANQIIALYARINAKIYSGKNDGTDEQEFMRLLDTAEDVSLLCTPLAERFLAGGSEDELTPSLQEILHKLQQAVTAPGDG